MFKMAAMAEIEKSPDSNYKRGLSLKNQLICMDTMLYKITTDKSGKVQESKVNLDAFRQIREPSPIISYYTEVLEDESISIE